MKIIAIDQQQFYDYPQRAWAEIDRVLSSSVDAPVFIPILNESSIEANATDLSPNLPLVLAECLNENLQLPILKCRKILTAANQGILFLDLVGINLSDSVTIAQLFARTAFDLHRRPTAYLLLVNALSGADIVEHWYKAFYIEPYSPQQLSFYLNRTLFKMRGRAFVSRYFGSMAERILGKIWRLSQKIRRR